MTHRCVTLKMVFATLAWIVLIAGCGELSQNPFVPDHAAIQQKGGDPFTIVLMPNTPGRAAKPVLSEQIRTRTDRGWFSPVTSGGLRVGFDSYARVDQIQVKTATFAVTMGSINKEAQVSMAVSSGSTLEDILIRFAPSHVVQFDPPAMLTLVLQGDPLLFGSLAAYHISGGTITKISTQVTTDGSNWTVVINVPGFSRYSLDDEFAPEAGVGF